MTAREWGTLTPGDMLGGDAQLAPGYSRAFLTESPAGFPQVLVVTAYPAAPFVGAADEEQGEMRDVCLQTDTHTYLMGADPTDPDAQPFDSDTDYSFPVDYWPPSTLDAHGQPTTEALDATARAEVRNLPTAWLDAMPTPTYPTPALES